MKPLPRYACHKEVQALKIAELRVRDNAMWLVFEHYMPIRVTAEYVAKHNPRPGGYYVVYDDGYESWSPAGAFEAGYTLIPE